VIGLDKIQSPAKEQQQQRSFKRMAVDCAQTFAFLYPIGNRKGNGNADDKHKKGLNQIPEMQAVPLMMFELGSEELKKTIVDLEQFAKKMRGFAGQ